MQYAPTLPANGRRAHTSETISGADGRRPPLLDLSPAGPFEGAYAIRPYPTGGWVAVAREMVSDGSQWMAMARKKVSDGSESALWGLIRFQVISK